MRDFRHDSLRGLAPSLFLVCALALGACSSSSNHPDVGVAPPGDSAVVGDSETPIDSGPVTPPDPSSPLGSLRITSTGGDSWTVTGGSTTGSTRLASVPGHNAFWFAWSVFHGGTDLWGVDANVATAVIAADPSGDCGVPCSRIASLLRPDGIPPLDDPTMVAADDVAHLDYLNPTDTIFGVITPEGPRAYPENILWWHEIANEDVGGVPYTVSFCPLTGSGIYFDRTGFVEGEVSRLGTSGSLFDSNLVMWDRGTNTLWSQMKLEAIKGPKLGNPSPIGALFEMDWQAWKGLHPDTLVISGSTGFSRDYTMYPYGGFRTDDADTFMPTEPAPDPRFGGKDLIFGLFVNGEIRGYRWETLASETGARRGLVQDELGGMPVAIVFDLDHHFVHAFDRSGAAGAALELSLTTTP